ncbi:hypothetical protein LCGC14_1701260 [marine sediment metagenome]|uniref:Rhamnogalacturonase A/B/Epimerase-like pectate lyase domain-containing protein n=1 Tax=marine sediment metagenome TaxID=412755 RepID=A0A0F9HIE1_9ZZZZ
MTLLASILARAQPRLTDVFYGTDSGGTTDYKFTLDQFRMGIISVKDYRAVGDGSTNDTVAIQAAFTAAAVNGGTVYFPATAANIYLIGDSGSTIAIESATAEPYCILVGSNTSVIVDKNVTIKLADSQDAAMFINGGGVTGGTLDTNIHWEGGTLDGNKANQSASPTATMPNLYFHNLQYCSFRNITFVNVKRRPARILGIRDSDLENLLCKDSDERGFHFGFGADRNGHQGFMLRCYIDNVVADLVVLAPPLIGPPNPLAISAIDSHFGYIASHFSEGSIKVQNNTTGCIFEHIAVFDGGVGLKITDVGLTQNSFGVLEGRRNGEYNILFEDSTYTNVGQMIAEGGGEDGGAPSIRIGDNVNHVNIGSIVCQGHQLAGVVIRAATTELQIGEIIVEGNNRADTGQQNLDIQGDNINIGRIINVGDAVALVNRGIQIKSTASNVHIGSIINKLNFKLFAYQNQSTDSIRLDHMSFDGDPFLLHTGAATIGQFGAVHAADTSGGVFTLTVEDGTWLGESRKIWLKTAGNDLTVTVTNHETSSPEVFTMADVGDYLSLEWGGTKWVTVANFGAAV